MSGGPFREWNSESYHRLSEPQFAWGMKVLERLSLRGDETVLDAGCGSGRLTAELVRRLPRGRVIALDASENMLRAARRTLATFGDQVQFVQADLLELPAMQPLDGVFSTAVFHRVLDHSRLYANLLRALKPGGWLDAQCGGGPNLLLLRQRAAELIERPEYRPFFTDWEEPWIYIDAGTATTHLLDAGFEDAEAWLEHTPAMLDDPVLYREYLETVTFNDHAARITDLGLRELFFDELVAKGGEDDPPYVMDYWRLNLRARKAASRVV